MELLSDDGAIDMTNCSPLDDVTSRTVRYFEAVTFSSLRSTPCMENGKGAFVSHDCRRDTHLVAPSFMCTPRPRIVYRSFPAITSPSILFCRALRCREHGRRSWHKRVVITLSGRHAFFLPPLPEQQRIAAYLDASCAAIDAAVAAKRRQLETLDEIRRR